MPEVVHVVSKTGAPELATGPMGMEQTDVYIQIKPQEEWREGMTKEEIGLEIAEAIERDVPEVAGAISQPIQMRTNELIAGVRSDVAVLLYGPDLDQLAALGEKAAAALRGVPGAEDVRAEQVSGLRYLRVIPDRGKLARYGLTIEDVNQVTETMAVGHGAGQVLEGERRFSIVVKTLHGFDGDLDALRAQLAEQSSTLLGGHPRIKELRAQISDLDRQIREEAVRISRSLDNDARIAGARVESLGASLDQLKKQASATKVSVARRSGT